MATEKSKEKNKKTMFNNQWGTNAAGNSKDYRDKTATSNEWVSTNQKIKSSTEGLSC